MLIEIKDLNKVYKMGDNELRVLKDVSLNIDYREFVSIIGPSGSGKSTLMNMIGCLDTPTSGTYILDGANVRKLKDSKLAEIRNQKIGFIFQGFNLLQKLNVLDNVELPLVYQGIHHSERRKRALKVLEMVGLSDRVHHKPKELSGGQQQRVAIARALVTDAPIILADEPTGSLDSQTGIEIMNILKNLNEEHGVTIIIITHDNNLAKQAKRIIKIQDGVVYEETPLASKAVEV